ncbi:tyrosine-type recombinase/integrase [Moraxella caprae]|uniref:tyrosine-type recombinase/integrase n=1 Tax=Moraxella caprae TaxID=90240 RepID=UPI000401F087|nr:site-specific integrase [Moraxella caprae]
MYSNIIKGCAQHTPTNRGKYQVGWVYKPHKTRHKPAITEPYAFSKLLNNVDNVADTFDYNRQILQLLAMLFVRIGDLCAMRWEQVDLANGLWEFRPQKAGSRKDMNDVIVPLPRQAVAILRQLHAKTGDTPFVFYTGRKNAPHTDPQRINNALNSKTMNGGAGYLGVHCPHGFRASAKTMLMERLGYGELITELQLGNTMLNRYGRAYSRMEMLSDRQKMLQDWADYLDDLRAGKIGKVIYLTGKQPKAVNE